MKRAVAAAYRLSHTNLAFHGQFTPALSKIKLNQRSHPGNYGQGDADRRLGAGSWDALQLRPQRSSSQTVHNQAGALVANFAEIVNRDDVGMGQAGAGLCLTFKPAQRGNVAKRNSGSGAIFGENESKPLFSSLG